MLQFVKMTNFPLIESLYYDCFGPILWRNFVH